jgi:hypothetical protein
MLAIVYISTACVFVRLSTRTQNLYCIVAEQIFKNMRWSIFAEDVRATVRGLTRPLSWLGCWHIAQKQRNLSLFLLALSASKLQHAVCGSS